jgi:hypothetical protein
MAPTEEENPLFRTSRKPASIKGYCLSGSSYGTKPIFQNLKKTHLYMRFLFKWVLLKDKTHFSNFQKKHASTKPSHPHVAPFEENPLIQEPPLMETTIFLWNTRTF